MYRGAFDRCVFDGKGMANRVVTPWNANDSDCIFTNCTIKGAGPAGYGLWIDYSGYGIMFWRNTIVVNSSVDAVRLGGCCAWSRANSFLNNIVVNLGTGQAMVYGWDTRLIGLDYNDSDYNCFYAPMAANGYVIGIANSSFRGSLSGWQAYLAKNPGIIVPGGGTIYDQNSIEADPRLVSMTPLDVHIQGGSPCLDAGTKQYIAGTWISYNASATVTGDFEGDARPATRVDIGADEVAVNIIGSGSGQPGTTIALSLFAPADGGLPYVTGSSLGVGPIPIDTRKLGLGLDAILGASVNGYLPMIFQNFTGILDAGGKATAGINIPNLPALKGIRIYSAFLTLKQGAPSNIQSISNTFVFTIQ